MSSPVLFTNVLHYVDLGYGRSLAIAANGYRSHTPSLSGHTIVFVHGAGHHKELWEPTFEELFRLPVASSVREVWSFDMPSHGQAAQVNARQLELTPVITLAEFGQAMASFIRERLQGHRIVGVGHSAGTIAMLHIPRFLNHSPFTSLILLESMLASEETYMANAERGNKFVGWMTKMTLSRQRTWENRDALVRFLRNTPPWSAWEVRALNQYIYKGIQPVDAWEPTGPWTMTTTLEAEASNYTEHNDTALAAAEYEKACKIIPVHLVFCSSKSLVPSYVQQALIGSPEKPNVTSVRYLPNIGHWIPQEKPREVANIIGQSLDLPPLPAAAHL